MPPFTSLCLNQSPFACGSVGAIAQTGLVIWVQPGTWCSQAAGAHRHLVLAVQIAQVVLESRHQLVAKSGLTLLVLVVLKYL